MFGVRAFGAGIALVMLAAACSNAGSNAKVSSDTTAVTGTTVKNADFTKNVAYALTPGYETYEGLGWYGCIVQAEAGGRSDARAQAA